eukprot:GFUD01015128.1.p1 GENE.GFUD01015128.1~~GFUD01015128.1.p1  ORF type:complete len:241 (+),score=65.35 GFUD01015128.1:69-791(+)
MSFSLSALLLLLTALTSDATSGQFTLEDQESGGKCQGQVTACVVITQCGALLGLLPLIKSGNKKAKMKLLTSHCGFTGPLPMVCCNMKTGYQANKIAKKTIAKKTIAKKINSKLITETEILKESSTALITKTSTVTSEMNTTTRTEPNASEITKKTRSMLKQLKTRAEMVSAVETAPLTTKKSTITKTKKMTPTPPVTTKRTATKGLETTPFTTPASVLRSTNKLSDRLEPHWNFFRIGF